MFSRTDKYIRISIDISTMRDIRVIKGNLHIKEEVECVYERVITPFGNSAKVDAQKKWIGKRAYVLVIKD